jgi:hypothetical protein
VPIFAGGESPVYECIAESNRIDGDLRDRGTRRRGLTTAGRSGECFLKKKEKQNYGKNSKAFREVMAQYRQSLNSGLVQSVDVSASGSAAPDHARPSISDFRCDVDIAVRKSLKGVTVEQFRKCYIDFDSEDEIECNQHAIRILGGKHWSIVQRVGNSFVKAGLFGGYFLTVRHAPHRDWIAGASVIEPYQRKRDVAYEHYRTIMYEQTVVA